MSERAPVEVSLWTTQTALIFFSPSRRSRASICSGATPRRQCGASGSSGSLPGAAITSVARPRRAAIFCQSAAKWPVSTISTASPALSVLTSAASHAPVPDAG